MLKDKVLIINDIAGVGKVASNIVFPMLNAGGIDATILPTLLLSSNTEASKIITHSTQEIFNEYINVWQELDYHFDSIVTGYFAEVDQIDTSLAYYQNLKKKHSNTKLYVDPTMGDEGKLYSVFNEEVPKHISSLVAEADLVKPNITEACLMTGHHYSEQMPLKELRQLAQEVHYLGASNTVLTGVRQGNQIGFLYCDQSGETGVVMHQYFDHHFFGTGDIVFSLITIFHHYGFSLKTSLEHTAKLTEQAIQYTLNCKEDYKYGIFYQVIIPDLIKILQQSEQRRR